MNAVAWVSANDYDSPNAREFPVGPVHQLADGQDVPRVARGPATLAAVYPLNRIGTMELRTPLVVKVEWDDADVVMSHVKLRIWGVGNTLYEALDDFGQTFFELIRSYESTPQDEMTEGAVAYLQQLRSYL